MNVKQNKSKNQYFYLFINKHQGQETDNHLISYRSQKTKSSQISTMVARGLASVFFHTNLMLEQSLKPSIKKTNSPILACQNGAIN